MNDTLYIVVPCYNEEEVLPETSKRLKAKVEALKGAGKIGPDSRILFVNDGSRDRTWEMISDLHKADPVFSGVNLSRNRGHQNALLAGLMTAKDRCDMAISMDADLQDNIDAVDAMVDKFHPRSNWAARFKRIIRINSIGVLPVIANNFLYK